jgi:MGT family glycosyltransferase
MALEGHSFLFVTWNGGGNVPPTLSIARKLVARGHRVRVVAPPSLASVVRAEGCAFVAFARAPDRTRSSGMLLGRAATLALAPELARASPAGAFAAELLDALDAEAADVLVIDFVLAGAIAAAERTRLPTAALMHTVYCLPAPGRPPFGPALAPRSGITARLRDAGLARLGSPWRRRGLRDLNHARQRLRLPPIASAHQQLAHLDRILVTTSTAFDLWAGPLPANVRYVGPQCQRDARLVPPVASAEPLVLISLSTRFAVPGLVQRILDALRDIPVHGLLTLGPALQPDQLRPPQNITVTEFVDHSAVLPHASLVITHAGLGTVMAALVHGVPLLCVPLKADQFENAARIVALGAGQRLSRRATSAQLKRGAIEVLTDSRFRRAAQRLGQALADGQDADPVAELEALARARPAASQPALPALAG